MACKIAWKNVIRLQKIRTDIFPPLGVPECTLALQNAAFQSQAKWKETEKMK